MHLQNKMFNEAINSLQLLVYKHRPLKDEGPVVNIFNMKLAS